MQFSELQFLNLTMPAIRNQLSQVKANKHESYSETLFNDMKNLCLSQKFSMQKLEPYTGSIDKTRSF